MLTWRLISGNPDFPQIGQVGWEELGLLSSLGGLTLFLLEGGLRISSSESDTSSDKLNKLGLESDLVK